MKERDGELVSQRASEPWAEGDGASKRAMEQGKT
jgi:hypothetical protein